MRDEVENAIADDDIGGGIRHGERFDIPQAELHVLEARSSRRRPPPLDHLRRHVYADDPPGRPHGPGGKERVSARSRAQVHDDVPGAKRARIKCAAPVGGDVADRTRLRDLDGRRAALLTTFTG
jgi:hypothetical protein